MSVVECPETNIAVYEYTDKDFVHNTSPWTDGQPSQLSQFDKELHKRWDAAMTNGAFRYNIDHITTRIIPGPKSYVAQLNTLRATERRKPQEITSVSQPFNPNAFNFTWVKAPEIIFDLHNVTRTQAENGITNGSGETSSKHSEEDKKVETHRLVINISPMEYGHCLLVPEIYQQNPQILSMTAIRVAIETQLLCGHRGARLGFNSLCAFSSVNHLHFHMYYFTYEQLVDYDSVDHISGEYYEFTALPCPGFALQLEGTTPEGMARSAHKLTSYLHQKDIAHNLFLCRGLVFGEERGSTKTTVRLFIWPRKKFIGQKSSDEFNVACIELAGHLPIKEEAGYYNFTEEDVDRIIETALIPDDLYKEIKDEVIQMGQNSLHTS